MSKIIRDGNWCSIDMLDGKTLQDGELLRIHFPDGHTESTKIVVKKNSYEISDMGSPWTVRESHAFAMTLYHTVECLVPILGLEAQRIGG